MIAGALDPQQASSASEELKAALLEQGVLRTLAELSAEFAARLAAAPKGDTARFNRPMSSYLSNSWVCLSMRLSLVLIGDDVVYLVETIVGGTRK